MAHIDYKATVWFRMHLSKNANVKEVIEQLKTKTPNQFLEDNPDLVINTESLYDTEEYITPKENDNFPTVQVFKHKYRGLPLWENAVISENKNTVKQ